MTKKKSGKIYFIGIEGAGTSALAVIYKNLGYDVAGSDDGDHFYGDILEKNKIKIFSSYDKKNLPENVRKVVYSTCINEKNPEFQEAKKRNLEMKSYPEALADLFNKKMGIAVCGTHGKTTTTAMLAFVLDNMGLSPSAVVGSKVIDWRANSLYGKGDYFIIEADEYQNKLIYYDPWSAILTSVDYDHPDFYRTSEDYKNAFIDFAKKIPKTGYLIYCNDNRDVLDVAGKAKCRKVSFGFNKESDYLIKIKRVKFSQTFEIFHEGESLGDFKIKLPGAHNALNASSVIAFCNELGLDPDKVREVLSSFRGTARRFQKIGERNGSVLIDDYAHHPEEIKAALRAADEIFPDKNIVTVFHPHSFTRTKALLEDFANSFGDANEILILDIYGSAREDSGDVSSEDLVELINKYYPRRARYVPRVEDAIDILKDSINENDVVISMGAGDVWRVTHELAK
ncbi:MAG: UDP-N-acetylmuramate--L-alanine ligase [Candidatus Moranbacteria bacterium]|jgi:UDP-N-acetylmuramate--alanine ligase|nr:UDP-N-acetylmuramate--L-alanine ligase [Candidatus Moranbacteria bacterium]